MFVHFTWLITEEDLIYDWNVWFLALIKKKLLTYTNTSTWIGLLSVLAKILFEFYGISILLQLDYDYFVNAFIYSSSLAPPYLSRGPPVLQNPERVIPLSECERFEPHFQPNVALAPVPTLAQIPPLHHQQRRHYHEQRCHNNHRLSSPINEKQEQPFSSVNVKMEKKSPSQEAPAVNSYPTYYVSEDRRQKEATPPKEHKTSKMGEEEEESAAVTSSTVNVGPPSLAASSGGTPSAYSSDSDSESPKTDLEEQLRALHVPQDVIELARLMMLENAQLRRLRRSDKREISKLRSQLQRQELQQQQQQQAAAAAAAAAAVDSAVVTSETQDKKEEVTATAPRASAADSTETVSEDADAASLSSDNKESGSATCVLATNKESDQWLGDNAETHLTRI